MKRGDTKDIVDTSPALPRKTDYINGQRDQTKEVIAEDVEESSVGSRYTSLEQESVMKDNLFEEDNDEDCRERDNLVDSKGNLLLEFYDNASFCYDC